MKRLIRKRLRYIKYSKNKIIKYFIRWIKRDLKHNVWIIIKQLLKDLIDDFEINQKKVVVKIILKNADCAITILLSIIKTLLIIKISSIIKASIIASTFIKAFSFILFITLLSKSSAILLIIMLIKPRRNKRLLSFSP